MKPEKLASLIKKFALATDVPFSLYELTEHIWKKGIKAGEAEIADFADASDYLLKSDPLNERYVSRRTYFKGAQFRVTPLVDEVREGYLMPGHRFMPFLSHELFPAMVRLTLPDGSTVPVHTRQVPQREAMAALHFYGFYSAVDYLLFDDEKNRKKIVPPFEGDVFMRVFDLAAFYAASGFQPGDSLMFTVEDWLLGHYSVDVAPEPAPAAIEQWSASMSRALDDALDEFGADSDCNLQLALAMRNAQNDPGSVSLMENPPLSIAAYFNRQDQLAVKMVGEVALFWEEEDDPMEEAVLDALENPGEPESELDAFFQSLGLSLSDGEAEAYMRDALFHGQGDAGTVLERVTQGRLLFFASAANQDRFHELWQERWNEMQKDYSREQDRFGELRTRFLACNDKALAAVRQLDARGAGTEIFSDPVFAEFNEVTGMISAALCLFNEKGPDVDVPSELMSTRVMDQLEAAVSDVAERLVGGGSGMEEGGAVYQLKVSLKGAKPPIWRRILIPADMELIDLHHAIQAAMGWYNCHLHQFKQDRTIFLPNPDREFSGFGRYDEVDSTGIRIGDVLRSEKDRIDYEYDFGDSWEHRILLEKIIEPEEGKAYPVCIKGKRACPPEDCGGLWGYYAILSEDDSFMDPETIEHYLKEIGDPEAFDLQEANARLKHYF